MAEKENLKSGAWDEMKGFPIKIKFEIDKPVTIKFDKNFTQPEEFPNKDGDGVFYLFNCTLKGKKASFMTSAKTLLMGLKSHMPLAGETLTITKKYVGGKYFYYISNPDTEFDSSDVEVEDGMDEENEGIDVQSIADENFGEESDEYDY